jgi:hypothetical protein
MSEDNEDNNEATRTSYWKKSATTARVDWRFAISAFLTVPGRILGLSTQASRSTRL